MIIEWMKMKIKKIRISKLSTLDMLNWKQRISFLWNWIAGNIMEECQIRGGTDYPDKTFYIVRHDHSTVGLFSMYIVNAGKIRYALNHGYIPVVDLRNYQNCYQNDFEKDRVNAWPLFFDQPCGYSLEQAYRGKNIILSSMEINQERPSDSMTFFENREGILDEWRIFAEKYMIVKQSIREEAERRYRKCVDEKDVVLGVAIRGTDYVKLKPPGHPVQPDFATVIYDAEQMMKQYSCNKIFVSTEDATIAKQFKTHFQGSYFCNERKLFDYKDGYIIEGMSKDEDYPKEESGKEYLITQLMLNKTDFLLASRTSGVVGSVMMSNNWKKIEIYNLGRYPSK